MASFYAVPSLFLILFSASFQTISGVFSEQSLLTMYAKPVEKTTYLHFYFHDILGGKNPTAIKIITPPDTSVGGFGATFMIDDALTEGPEPTSKLVGKAQGIYALASQSDVELLMVINYAFTEGLYNGSTLSILGHNPILHSVREMPIVGGSGVFRLARGYALAKTVNFSPTTGNAVVEYNVTVSHF